MAEVMQPRMPAVERLDQVGDVWVLVTDSSTLLGPEASGQVAVCGSHGGINAALFAASAGVKAAIFNDAGVGKDAAGIAGLTATEPYGMAVAAADFMSARIGDGNDLYRSGLISHCNRWAEHAGLQIGMEVTAAARLLAVWTAHVGKPRPSSPRDRPPEMVRLAQHRIVVADSISQVEIGHIGVVVISGSHGGMVAGRAVKVKVGGAFFNDAGVGKDGAGITRLPVLEQQGIPAATVAHTSARIGDGLDTFHSGLVSHANPLALAVGVALGQTVEEAALALAQHAGRPQSIDSNEGGR